MLIKYIPPRISELIRNHHHQMFIANWCALCCLFDAYKMTNLRSLFTNIVRYFTVIIDIKYKPLENSLTGKNKCIVAQILLIVIFYAR